MTEIPVAKVVRVGAEREATTRRPVLPLAPRAIPRALVMRLLFGGSIAQFGWLFAAFGMAFTLAFLPATEVPFRSYDRPGMARVTSVEATNASEQDQPIYRVHFTFVDHEGVERRGASYTTKSDVGGELPVEYATDDPARARLVGMRAHKFGWFGFVVLVFPIAGLSLALGHLVRGRRAIRLLRHGVETQGTLVRKAPTKMKVNDQPIMAMTFEYQTTDGTTHTATVKTLVTAPLEDDAREKMLYDPFAPARATTLDHLPGAPVVKDGNVEWNRSSAALVLILPIATIALIVATAVVLFG